jgi:heme/copper-type cytochrome/quinol oxidase subunit 2
MWDKPKINFVIDILMFLCMSAMVGIGFLMKYVLIIGQERWVEYGRNVDLLFWGMNRHEWGDIHLYLGFTLLALLILHIILHWHLIPGLYRRLIENSQARVIWAWIFVAICLVLISFSVVVTPKLKEIETGEGRVHELHDSSIEVKGSMTLQQVSRQFDIPTGVLKEELNLPASTPDTAKLGRLRRTYRFTMSEVERIIVKHQKSGQ